MGEWFRWRTGHIEAPGMVLMLVNYGTATGVSTQMLLERTRFTTDDS